MAILTPDAFRADALCMATSVLTQTPRPIRPHAPTRTVPRSLNSSTATTTAAISMRSYVDEKTHLAETAHLQYASPQQDALVESPPSMEPSTSSSSSYFNHSADSDSIYEDTPMTSLDTGHYSQHAHAEPYHVSPSAHAPNAPPSDQSHADRQSKYDELADALTREPPSVLSSPPPVPPKTDVRRKPKSKSVSIIAPSDLLHDYEDPGRCALDYTVSEPGHSSTSSASMDASYSDRAPHRRMFASQSVSGHASSTYSYPSRLSWADKASVPIYRNSFPVASKQDLSNAPYFPESPSQPGRRKLRKVLSRPSSMVNPMTGPSTSSSGSRLWRALSLRPTPCTSDEASRSPTGKSTSKFFRTPHRAVSEHGHGDATPPTRPPVQPHGSGNSSTGSHSHSSSASQSTCLSSSQSSSADSTPVTPPDGISPVISPVSSLTGCVPELVEEEEEPPTLAPQLTRGVSISGGNATRKLKKRRPSQSSPRVPTSPETTSGMRRSKTQTQANSDGGSSGAFLPPINPEAPFGLDIPKELTQSPRSIFPTSLLSDRKKKSSTNALAQLAWTGLSSSELAALTSRLNIQRHSPERAAQFAKKDLELPPGSFDPYGESLYASGGNPKSMQINKVGDSPEEAEDGTSGSAIGHAVSSTFSTMRKKMTPVRESNPAPASALEHSGSPSASQTRTDTASIHADSDPRRHSSYPLPRPMQGLPNPHGNFLANDPMAMRRWTLAMADVPDEVLVQELDKIWKEGANKKGRAGKTRTPASSQNGHGSDHGSGDRRTSFIYGDSSGSPWKPGVHFQVGAESDSEDEEGLEEMLEEPEDEADEEEWRVARRALLCCRELVRTERNYQARLKQLLGAESSHPLFSLLLSYVPALLQASEALLVRLVDDPSAWGVSAAFIGCEEELEAAFVAWCGIVGEFFTDVQEKDKRGRKLVRKPGEEAVSAHGHGEVNVGQKGEKVATISPPLSARSMSQGRLALGKPKITENRRLSLFGTSENGGMFTAALGTGLAFGLSPASQPPGFRKYGSTASVSKDTGHGSATGTLTRTLSAWKRKSMPSSLYHLPSSIGSAPSPVTSNSEEKKLTVRDLAIQPTQRVMRYVLQYKDLLAHTPVASPSRGLVERALESAVRIAKKCDRAQDNSAFLRRP